MSFMSYDVTKWVEVLAEAHVKAAEIKAQAIIDAAKIQAGKP